MKMQIFTCSVLLHEKRPHVDRMEKHTGCWYLYTAMLYIYSKSGNHSIAIGVNHKKLTHSRL